MRDMITPSTQKEIFFIIQNFQLKENQLVQVKNLFEICETHDKTTPKIYWSLLSEDRPQGENFLLYFNPDNTTHETNESVLVGYLSFFFFDEEGAEISVLIHPEYRNRGVFRELLKIACKDIVKFSKSNKATFLLPNKENKEIKRDLKSLNAKFSHFEYNLERISQKLEVIPQTNLRIQQATKDDINLLANIHFECFQSDFDLMLARFTETISDSNREIWLCYRDNICLGKIHIRYEENEAYIHDFCILPEYQNEGNGKILLQSIINHVIKEKKFTNIYTDFISADESGLNLYTNCHFKIKNTNKSWSMRII